jgi:hypothetical protein
MSAHAHQEKKHTTATAPSVSAATLRDTFAAAVMSSLCHSTLDDEGQAADVARRAYLMADAMLTARDEEHTDKAAAPKE